MSDSKMTRRTFVFGTALTAATAAMASKATFPFSKRRIAANERVHIAGIGVGGKGSSDVDGAAAAGENPIVALCDVDWERAADTFNRYPDATRYKDFRVMLEKEYANIDAVTISTSDHMHAPAAIAAMQLGKHVYVQKPLTHDVFEARRLKEVAEQYGVATQMGNQGHSAEGVRRLCEWIWAGAIGNITEAHIWTNRPIWPQAIRRPKVVDKIPETLDWDLWLGTAPERPYNHCYAPFAWRGWWDFGCGALGDMACHIMDPAYTALKLTYPTKIEAVQEGNNEETFPKWSIITYEFAARGDMPPCKIVWYDGGKQPPRPEEVAADETLGDGDNGTLFIGDKGKLACGCYGGGPTLIPRSRMEEFKRPEKTIPDSTGHYQEWIDSIKGTEPPAGALAKGFGYAGPFTEMVLLGNLAVKAGEPIEYDAEKMKITNNAKANRWLKRTYRKEWRDLA
ncbi:MAG TPA: Gfo/Idh/MocA family oxidoreductase [Candidatus Hydrogenedentes bacterium]|nr:Gfo/Idh/MocA family oxidoreductase [Candidatus Hydrogenedentota bacterium]HPG68422.1 Gfo/Idh/MocA family oxidoreductase [Candidatus Hydrogenedentota bacterium]